MEVKSEYKMTEIGKIPVDWEIKELDSISKVIMGQSPKSSSYNDEGEGLPFYQGRSEFGDKYPIPMKWCTEPSKIAEKDDVLFTVRAPVGDVNMCQEKSCIGRGLGAIRHIENVTNHWFLYYSLMYSKEKFSSLSQGSTFTAINGEELRKFKLPKPPIKEQQKIAEILSTVDEQIEQTDQLIEKTKELKKGLLQQLLTKGIGHTEFKQTELGEIPVKWDVAAIKEVATTMSGGTPNRSNRSYYQDGTIPWVKTGELKNKYISNIDEFITNEAIQNSSAKIIEKNSVVVAMYGATIGQASILSFPAATNQACCAIISGNKIYYEYLYYYLKSKKDYLTSLGAGGAQPNISQKIIQNIKIALPPIEEQYRMAETFSSIDEEIEGWLEEKSKYEELKKGLMQQLLTGKTRVKVD